MKYAGPIPTCFKRGNSFTPKNAVITQENVALDAFFGHLFKTRPLVFL